MCGKCFLKVIFFITFLFVETRSAQFSTSTMSTTLDTLSTISACSQACIAREELRNATLANIKQEILMKLGMTTPPTIPANIKANLPPLEQILGSGIQYQFQEGMQGDQPATGGIETLFQTGPTPSDDDFVEKDYYIKTKRIIAFSRNNTVAPEAVRHLPLQLFQFADSSYKNRVQKANLYVYIKGTEDSATANNNESVPFIDIQIYKIKSDKPHMVIRHITTIKLPEGPGTWINIDVTRLVTEWFIEPRKNLGMYISAKDSNEQNLVETSPQMMPFLELHTTEGKKERSRRSIGIDCEIGSEEKRCCRYPLEVDFEEFGWDWVIAPKKYDAFFCAGECPFVFLQKYPHTHVISQVVNKPTTAGPCCAPRKLGNISMLYFNTEFNIVFGKLPNMVVETCGCF